MRTDTQKALDVVARAAAHTEDFEPRTWTVLPGLPGTAVLLSDGSRDLVASITTGAPAVTARARGHAGAVLRMVLPDTAVAFCRTVTERPLDDDAFLQVREPLPGRPASTRDFLDSPALVADLASFLAALHEADPGPVADAGLVVRDAREVRDFLLAELDRAAVTGEVPAVLLDRWEHVLETAGHWHFLAGPVHGSLSLEALWVSDDRLTALDEADRLRVGDPALDLAAVGDVLGPDLFEDFFTAYTQARSNPDVALRDRVDFLAEFAVLDWFLTVSESGTDPERAEALAMLRDLAALYSQDTEYSPDEEHSPEKEDTPEMEGTPDGAHPVDRKDSPGHRDSPGDPIDADRAGFRPAAAVELGSDGTDPEAPTRRDADR